VSARQIARLETNGESLQVGGPLERRGAMGIRIFGLLVLLALGFSVGGPPALAQSQPPAEGGVLPVFDLPVPAAGPEQDYLGVAGKTVFSIADIRAEVVIIEIFNMY
jgi:hypothetical protein